MQKKIIIIIIIFFMGGIIWLFHNDFPKPFLRKEIINNPSPDKKTESYEKPGGKEARKEQALEAEIKNNVSGTTTKTDLENYFFTLANVNLPESNLISDAITLHLKGEEEGLKIIIALLKERNKEIYKITPPKEAENIHKNNIWAVNKMINILEEILNKASNQEEFNELIKKLEVEETQKIIFQTNQEIMSLVANYNLDSSFLK